MDQQPTAEQHLAFLVKLQRLLSEGDFSATYKFALLIALADISVERGHDDVRPLEIPLRDIAEKFIDYYWQQTMSYTSTAGGLEGKFIKQNHGQQAAVLTAIQEFREIHNLHNLGKARKSLHYPKLVTAVRRTVAAKPIVHLQVLGGAEDEFIFPKLTKGTQAIQLKRGVSAHLRKFHPLIQQMTRTRWVEFIKSVGDNQQILGNQDRLYKFLFESSRESMDKVRFSLLKLESRACFYCRNPIRNVNDAHVDHFIPFSLYGRDILQNFVLAHRDCNISKSDVLAGYDHLVRWIDRLEMRREDLNEIADEAGVISDNTGIKTVANWSYHHGQQAEAQAWIKSGKYEPITESYLSLFR
jgi:hypothetical protein